MGSSQLKMLPPRGLTADNDQSLDVKCTGAELSNQSLGTPQTLDLPTCYICQGTSDQESIMLCDGRWCSVIARLNCYFSAGSQDANDAITDIEHCHCEKCGGLPRHMHPRPQAAKRARVSFGPDLAVATETLITQRGSATGLHSGGWGRHWPTRTEMPQLATGKGKEAMEPGKEAMEPGHPNWVPRLSDLYLKVNKSPCHRQFGANDRAPRRLLPLQQPTLV